jgi:tol-pal system protein YbgF
MNENRRLQQQIDAMGTENRNLTARSAEMETRINEMAASPKVETPTPPPSGAATGYDEGLDAFHRRDFTGAIRTFQGLLEGNVRETLADNCHYWMGESYYGMRQYKQAVESFDMVLNYKDSEKKDDAQLMIANAKAAMGDKVGAREAYNTLISSYPTSSLVEKARERLAKLK